MLVAISDIHFTDGSAGEFNVERRAFEGFFKDIFRMASDTAPVDGKREMKILLIGDIFDLLRSYYWQETEAKPWDRDREPDSKELAEAIEIIFKRIYRKNQETLKFIQEVIRTKEVVGQRLPKDIELNVSFVKGNHDIIIDISLNVVRKICEIFNMPQDTTNFPSEFLNDDYSIYATHGHKYFIPRDKKGCEKTSLAELGAIWITSIPYKFRDYLIKKQIADEGTAEHIKTTLQSVDNVRPLMMAIPWVFQRVSKEAEQLKKALKDFAIKEISEIRKDPFFKEEISKQKMPFLFKILFSFLKTFPLFSRCLLQLIPSECFVTTALKFVAGNEKKDDEMYITKATEELTKGKQFILYGHTHRFMAVPLDLDGPIEKTYLNTGTWRPRVLACRKKEKIPEFSEIKHLNYVVLYRPGEDKSKYRHYELWHGELSRKPE